jgi:hypothetical protein
MNINFMWGNDRHAFPKSNQYILDDMESYIKSKKNETQFLPNFRKAVQHLPESNPDMKEEELKVEFKKQFKALFNTALDIKILPILQANTAAWDKFVYKKRVAVGAGKDKKDTTLIDETKLDWAKELTYKDLRDLEVKDLLMKQGSLKYSRDKPVPDFDFNEWLSGYDNNTQNDVEHIEEATAVEVILRPNAKGDKYQYSHSSDVNTEDAHIVGYLPALEASQYRDRRGKQNKAVDDLVKAQREWIIQQTDMEGDFIAKEQKIKLAFTEAVEYPIYINADENPKLSPQTEETEDKTAYWRQEIEEKDGKWTPIGTKEYIARDDFFDFVPKVLPHSDTQAGGQNSQELYDEQRYIEDGVNYTFAIGDKKERMELSELSDEIELNWGIGDTESPFSFISDNIDLFKAILEPRLNDPLTVYTVKILGKIKLSQNTQKTMGEKLTAQNKQRPTEKNPEPARYQTKRYRRKTGKGRTISTKEYEALPDNKKSTYESIGFVDMTPKQIQEATSKAFKLKTDASKTISEHAYHKLNSLEKEKYAPNIGVATTQGERDELAMDEPESEWALAMTAGKEYKPNKERSPPNLDYQTSKDTGEVNYSSSGLLPDEIIVRFKDAIVTTEFVLIKHGEFKINPLSRESENIDMKNLIRRISDNILAMTNKLPRGE